MFVFWGMDSYLRLSNSLFDVCWSTNRLIDKSFLKQIEVVNMSREIDHDWQRYKAKGGRCLSPAHTDLLKTGISRVAPSSSTIRCWGTMKSFWLTTVTVTEQQVESQGLSHTATSTPSASQTSKLRTIKRK